MTETATVEIPDRPVFKAAEVCELVKVQPYVLRTWEAEFPELGEAKATGSGRIYRRDDVARVLRIKHLLLVEGLTLAGARRRMEQDASGETAVVAPAVASVPAHAPRSGATAALSLTPDVRERIRSVKSGLQSLLEMLNVSNEIAAPRPEFTLEPVDDGAPPPRMTSSAKSSKSGGTSSKASVSPKRKR